MNVEGEGLSVADDVGVLRVDDVSAVLSKIDDVGVLNRDDLSGVLANTDDVGVRAADDGVEEAVCFAPAEVVVRTDADDRDGAGEDLSVVDRRAVVDVSGLTDCNKKSFYVYPSSVLIIKITFFKRVYTYRLTISTSGTSSRDGVEPVGATGYRPLRRSL